jgi:uncharacterized SAM-binding protein YcdF (DUF218 family)
MCPDPGSEKPMRHFQIPCYERARILPWLGSKLRVEDPLDQSDAIMVLDGGEGSNRFVRGLELLRKGIAPILLVGQSALGESSRDEAEELAGQDGNRIRWLNHRAASTAEEAVSARQALEKLRCSSLLIVSSFYHSRRAKLQFLRALSGRGVQLRVAPADVPGDGDTPWTDSKHGRFTIFFELAKLLAAYLRLDGLFPSAAHYWLKVWVGRVFQWTQAIPGRSTAASGRAEEAKRGRHRKAA